MKMNQFNFFFSQNIFVCLKSSNIEENSCRSASDLISVDEKYSSGEIILEDEKLSAMK